MRIRTIKPEWLSSQKLASSSDAARVLSVALILMSDDYGRGRGSLAEIAMQVWRYDMTRDDGAKARETLAKVRETLEELSATGFVRVYQVNGDDFFELPGWASHQRVDKPGKSKIPESYQDHKNIRETVAKNTVTLATDQGSGIRDQGKDQGEDQGEGASASAASDADAAAKAEEEAAKRAAALRYRKLVTLGWKTASDAMKASGHGGSWLMKNEQNECWPMLAEWALRTERARADIGQTVSAEDAIGEAVQEWVSSGFATGSGWNPENFCKNPDRYFLKDGIKAREAWEKRAGLK